MESPKAEIVNKENPLYDNSDSAFSKSKKKAHPNVMSVMIADITAEAAMTEMERKINLLMKVVEERDYEITTLRAQMRICETAKSSQTSVVKASDKGKNVNVAWVPTSKIPAVRLKRQSKVAHRPLHRSIEKAGSGGDQLFRQFVRSLKENTFEWYIDLESKVIDSWEQLEKEFFNRFYSTRCILSITSRGAKVFLVLEGRKDKKETNGAEKIILESTVKKSIVVNTPC
ncbi:retrotransposon gag protein [Cucumis melo var. makuwa]|uniref:Retrotransposon gag protein n=1 Tax=Cucumis melo var. makuwa TaxID=1194695 RepID=A0A5D3BP99_CUCMM|nr:retrotransposon gag protein [Cucumis melo var. makuwa]TYK01034.1 retrotransposon gag protein [Cucumis melo var. makuwa]